MTIFDAPSMKGIWKDWIAHAMIVDQHIPKLCVAKISADLIRKKPCWYFKLHKQYLKHSWFAIWKSHEISSAICRIRPCSGPTSRAGSLSSPACIGPDTGAPFRPRPSLEAWQKFNEFHGRVWGSFLNIFRYWWNVVDLHGYWIVKTC